jgi:hypothetical protein
LQYLAAKTRTTFCHLQAIMLVEGELGVSHTTFQSISWVTTQLMSSNTFR